jgi:filamentous hemagglutinin family protein
MFSLINLYNSLIHRKRKAVRIKLRFHHHLFPRSFEMTNNPFSLPDTMQVGFTATFVDVLGNPTLVSSPSAVIDNTNIATVALTNVSTTPVSSITGVVSAVGPVGTANLTITGVNPDGSLVSVTQVINVVTSFATDIQIVFGTPTPIPPPPVG